MFCMPEWSFTFVRIRTLASMKNMMNTQSATFPGAALSVSDGLMRRASRAKTVAMWVKAGFPILLDNLSDCLLDKAVQHRRDAQRAGIAVGFGNGDPPDRFGSVGLLEQLLPDLRPVLTQIIRQSIHGHAVDARRSLVTSNLFQGAIEVVPAQYTRHPR
ncbi:hypothetical protein Msub_20497 [Marinobacter subterrani]|uniref:Uncharacterized protein n=1 Tax=Marinobacter subterrani TaxID=1658765 RepID=A0A0J7J3Y9_9GAMM|nr:hypothetical protein Msub_20497 [Marinobacter subterrani]